MENRSAPRLPTLGSALGVTLLVTALSLLLPSEAVVRGQDGSSDQPLPEPPVAPIAPWPQIPARLQAGGCETTGMELSRSFIGRFDVLEWWGWGFATGTSVGVQLIDPTGQATARGAVATDTLCEVSGVLPTENRVPGVYTLVLAGTRAGGGPLELATAFNIVSLTHTPPATPTPPAPPLPNPPGGVRATTLNPNTIRIEWTDNSDNELGFRINSEAGQFQVPANTTSFNAGGLQPLRIYCFTVTAYNAAGESPGATSCAQTPSGSAPGTPPTR